MLSAESLKLFLNSQEILLLHDHFTNHGSRTYGPDLNRFQEKEKLNSIKNLLTIVSLTQIVFVRRNYGIEDTFYLKPDMYEDNCILDHA